MTAWEHLDLLRAHIERRVPELAVFLAPDARLLEARRRGGRGVYVRWDHAERAYVWASGPDTGGRVGADAGQAALQVERALLL